MKKKKNKESKTKEINVIVTFDKQALLDFLYRESRRGTKIIHERGVTKT